MVGSVGAAVVLDGDASAVVAAVPGAAAGSGVGACRPRSVPQRRQLFRTWLFGCWPPAADGRCGAGGCRRAAVTDVDAPFSVVFISVTTRLPTPTLMRKKSAIAKSIWLPRAGGWRPHSSTPSPRRAPASDC